MRTCRWLLPGGLAVAACGGSGFGLGTSSEGGADASDDVVIIVGGDATTASDGDAGPTPGDSSPGDSHAAGCTAPLSLSCNGVCVDPTLPANCGGCGNKCEGPDGSMPTCTNGKCGFGCTGSTLNCNGACVDPTTPAHCGGCAACAGPDAGMGMAMCSLETDGGHQCTVQCDGITTLQCGTSCFDPHDVNHCGACGTVCPTPTNGNPICTGATPGCDVACDTGFHSCDHKTCQSNSDDPSNTGDPCILSTQFGVFVATPASGGSDVTGTGSPTAPFATISHALGNLGSTSRVYVCNGSYSDAVTVTTSVGIYGGLSCPSGGAWSYVGGKATVTSTSATGGATLVISGVSGPVKIEDMGFASQNAVGVDGAGNGLSSIAVQVNASGNVSFVRSALQAGNGANALQTPPTLGNNYTPPTAPGGSVNRV